VKFADFVVYGLAAPQDLAARPIRILSQFLPWLPFVKNSPADTLVPSLVTVPASAYTRGYTVNDTGYFPESSINIVKYTGDTVHLPPKGI
jgi:hypothetical protein